MLDALRASSQTWVGRSIMAVVMGLLVIAFGFWGIADIFRGFGANTLARVGSAEITPRRVPATPISASCIADAGTAAPRDQQPKKHGNAGSTGKF